VAAYSNIRVRGDERIYLQPDHVIVGDLGLKNHSALICGPMLFKGNTIIGVLCVGSFDDASLLHSVLQPEELRRKFIAWFERMSIDAVDELIKIAKAD
jgi:hypothetical protein